MSTDNSSTSITHPNSIHQDADAETGSADINEVLPERFLSPADLWQKVVEAGTEEKRRLLEGQAEELGQMHEAFGSARTDRLGKEAKSEEEILEALEQSASLPDDLAGETLQPGREPLMSEGALQMDTIRLPIGSEAEKIDEASSPRYCAGGLYQKATGRDLRAKRIEVVVPTEGITVEYKPNTPQKKSLLRCVPLADTPAKKEAVQLVFGGNLGDWQRQKVSKRLRSYLEANGLIPVFSTPETPVRDDRGSTTGFKSYTVTVMDREEAYRFTGDVGELHYLGGLFSGGGYVPGSEMPDYRRYTYIAMTPEEASKVGELLGAGPFVGEEGEVIVDGRAPILLPEWPDEDYLGSEVQYRAITGHDGNGELSFTKGMGRPYHPEAIKRAVEYYEEEMYNTELEGEFAVAHYVLRCCLDGNEPVVILVKDDMVKVGDERMAENGEALFAATFLRGHFDATGEGANRRPDEQYRIIGGTQLTQFLKPEGFELLEEHLEIEVGVLKEKLQSLEGIAEIASQRTAQQLEDVASGERSYQPGADMLSDAILGGGVRMSGSGWRSAFTGEQDSGHVQMLNSTRGRLDFAVAGYIRRQIFRGLGIYGYGSHHGTCADSQALLKHLWRTWVSPNYLDNARKGQMQMLESPIADTSATALPAKVTHLMNRDDDGDITISLAAEMEVGGKPMKVILTWGFPVVDVPVLWAMPAETDTPFDARSDVEDERFRRILKIFGPELRDDQPALAEDGITLLRASNAWRLSNKGAKQQVSKQKVRGELDLESALAMVDRKRQLNRAGPLTRDLERLGDLMAASQIRGTEIYQDFGAGHPRIKQFENAWQKAFKRACSTSVSIEENLTAFKYQTQPDLSSPNLRFVELGLEDGSHVRNEILPLDYHHTTQQLTGILPQHSQRRSGHTLTDWEGPSGRSRHARLLNRIVNGPLQKVAGAMERIDTSVEPFRQAIRRRLQNWWETDATNEDVDRVKREASYVEQLCGHYREFWRKLMDKESELMRAAKDERKMREKIDEWHSQAARQITLTMQAMSRAVSWQGLAMGIYNDWEVQTGRDGESYGNSPAAGVALITGRMGQVLLPPEIHVEPVEPTESFTVVWRAGAEIPADRLGQTTTVRRIAVDREERVIYAELPSGETIDLRVDEEQTLPPEAAVIEDGPYRLRLSATAPSQGILRWMRG